MCTRRAVIATTALEGDRARAWGFAGNGITRGGVDVPGLDIRTVESHEAEKRSAAAMWQAVGRVSKERYNLGQTDQTNRVVDYKRRSVRAHRA